jgi:hypothetical protein
MRNIYRLAFAVTAVATVLLQSACKKEESSPTQAPTTNIAGTWKGTCSDTSGTGTLTFILSQDVRDVSGSWSITYSQSGMTMGGQIGGGHVYGDLFYGNMSGGHRNCAVYLLFWASISGTSMSGTYNGDIYCVGRIPNGRFDLTKQ